MLTAGERSITSANAVMCKIPRVGLADQVVVCPPFLVLEVPEMLQQAFSTEGVGCRVYG